MRAERRIDQDATGRTSLAGCRTAMRVACEPEARLNRASERVRDAADIVKVSKVMLPTGAER